MGRLFKTLAPDLFVAGEIINERILSTSKVKEENSESGNVVIVVIEESLRVARGM